MPDSSGQADIRGIDVDKLAKGFADEPNVIKNFVVQSKTKAREVRWFQKTAGFLDTATTDDTAGTLITNTASMAIAPIAEQSWTRNTSYVIEFMVESPLISDQDIKDNDVDILGTNVRDLVRAVDRKVDLHLFAILTDALASTPTLPLTGSVTVQNTAATGTGWDDIAGGNPILDILNGKQLIRASGYNPRGAMMGMNSVEEKNLLNYLISVKGSSIPGYSSEKVKDAALIEVLGFNVLVNEAFTTDWVVQWVPDRAVTYKAFSPLQAVKIVEPLIGVKIRVREEGIALLTDPNAVHVISDTVT